MISIRIIAMVMTVVISPVLFFTGLWGIINNVTAFIPGHCEYQTAKSIEDLVARNFTSMITLTQMFLPLIRKINGRVVNVVNLQGMVILQLISFRSFDFGIKKQKFDVNL